MRHFVYHLKDSQGNKISYVTEAPKLSELIAKHAQVLAYLVKGGFTPIQETSQVTMIPQASTQTSTQAKTCTIHNVQMLRGVSKKTNKPYFYHDGDEGRCFGRGYQPSQY